MIWHSLSRQQFQEQLDYFKDNGYNTISLMDYIRAKKYGEELPPNPIILTFDDGYEDNYINMMPMVQAMGMKATMFMATNYIGKEGYVNWQQLKEMQDNIKVDSDYENQLQDTKNIEQEIEEKQKQDAILQEIYRMKQEDQDIFLCYYYYAKSIKEIAKDLHITESKVKSRLFRIRNKLKKKLEKRGYSYYG